MKLPELFTRVLEKVDRLLDRYIDAAPGRVDLAHNRAFAWDGQRKCLQPVRRTVQVDPEGLLGIDDIKQQVLRNTAYFVSGGRANNVLLWGERGTGKSSLVKSMLHAFRDTDLRMIQVLKHDILTVQDLYAVIAANTRYRFILFIDDLSFEEGQTDYKEMKTIMDGGLEEVPENVLFYATSNRKHLVPTRFSDSEGDTVRPSDTLEEKVSLVDRFGLRQGFYHSTQDAYLDMVRYHAKRSGLRTDEETLRQRALQWCLAAGGRNGRVAEQFVRAMAGEEMR